MNTFYHSGQCGDIIYSLPTVRAMGGGVFITGLSYELHRALEPLLRKQSYITDVKHISEVGLPKDVINLDKFRSHPQVDKIHLVNSHLETFGFPKYDWDQGRWLELDTAITLCDNAVINVTERYTDKLFDWKKEFKYLKNTVQSKVYFLGTFKEYAFFTKKYNVYPWYYGTNNFLEAAYCIEGTRYFSGNQSALMAIRQGLGMPYRIHRSPYMANCNQWSNNETIINPISRKFHIIGNTIKKLINNA